jgi:hypothetical protein
MEVQRISMFGREKSSLDAEIVATIGHGTAMPAFDRPGMAYTALPANRDIS